MVLPSVDEKKVPCCPMTVNINMSDLNPTLWLPTLAIYMAEYALEFESCAGKM